MSTEGERNTAQNNEVLEANTETDYSYTESDLVDDLANSAIKYFHGERNMFGLKDAMEALEQRYDELGEPAPGFVQQEDYGELENILKAAQLYEDDVSGIYLNPPEVDPDLDAAVPYWSLEL